MELIMEQEYENECLVGENTGSFDFMYFSRSVSHDILP